MSGWFQAAGLSFHLGLLACCHREGGLCGLARPLVARSSGYLYSDRGDIAVAPPGEIRPTGRDRMNTGRTSRKWQGQGLASLELLLGSGRRVDTWPPCRHTLPAGRGLPGSDGVVSENMAPEETRSAARESHQEGRSWKIGSKGVEERRGSNFSLPVYCGLSDCRGCHATVII